LEEIHFYLVAFYQRKRNLLRKLEGTKPKNTSGKRTYSSTMKSSSKKRRREMKEDESEPDFLPSTKNQTTFLYGEEINLV
jgi:hypothetical protein